MQGNIPLENLDDRTWQELVDQATMLAQQYVPQWSDLGPADLGMTLIELFAWLVEGMQYRLNRVPDRTYAAMLNLVGVTRDPARPAVTMLTFTPQVPPPSPGTFPVIPAGTKVSTTATEQQAPITFETDSPNLTVLPANLVWAFKPVSGAVPQDISANLIRSPLAGQTLAMLAGDPPLQFYFGFDNALNVPFALNVRLAVPPQLVVAAPNWLKLAWTYSVAGTPALAGLPSGTSVVDSTNSLQQSGTIQFPQLTTWTSRTLKDIVGATFPTNDPAGVGARSAFWLCLTVTAPPPTGGVKNIFTVNLAHVLFNSVSATYLITVPPNKPEVLTPPSTGQAWQQYQFQHAPLYKIPGVSNPYSHVAVTADEPQSGGGTSTQSYPVVDDFPKAPDLTRCCRLDPVTATILFGSNDGTAKSTGTGLIPPTGSVIKASYRAVAGGAEGNVAPGVLVLFTPPAGILAVTNPGPGREGADQESVDDAKLRAPDLLRIRSRAVTVADYEYLALEASTLVKKATALGTSQVLDGRGNFSRAPGEVTVLIVPDAPLTDPHPATPADLIDEVRSSLDAARVVTTTLTVSAPRYLPVSVKASVNLFPSAQATPAFITQLTTDLQTAATAYLHPLFGGPDGAGWDIGADLFVAGLFAQLQAVVGSAGFIASLSVGQGPESTRPPTDTPLAKALDPAVGLGLLDFELLCSSATHPITVTPLT